MAKEIPHDLLMEILSWLPLKPILRFRSVSKTWLQLLTTNSQFTKLHVQRIAKHNNNHPGMVALRLEIEKPTIYYAEDCTVCDEAIKFELPYDKSFYVILGVCNGLICIANGVEEYACNISDIYVCNPLTGDHVMIPSPTLPDGPKFGTTFAFGFNPSSSEYKVVWIVTTCKFWSNVEVYTLGMNSWRILESISYGIGAFRSVTALVNGAIHWYGCKAEGDVIIAFDVKDEIFQEIPRPRAVDYNSCDVEIGELGGLLSMFCIFGQIEVCEIQMWVMKEYGVAESWTKGFKIGRPDVLGQFSFLQPLGVTRDGEIIIKKDNSKVLLYNPNTGTCREPREFGFRFYDAYPYIGSLVSPKSFSRRSEET